MTTGRARGPLDRLAVWIGSGALCGYFPVAPATFASAVALVPLAWIYPVASRPALAAGLVLLAFLGVWSASRLERLYGHDPSAAVIDEWLGMALTLAVVPITPATLLLGFAFFRVFDVLKLPPGRALERLPGGWGVMADDASAGVYAAAALRLVLWRWPEPRLEAWHAIPIAAAAALLFVFRKPLLRRYGKKKCDLRDGLGSVRP